MAKQLFDIDGQEERQTASMKSSVSPSKPKNNHPQSYLESRLITPVKQNLISAPDYHQFKQ